MYIIPPEFIYNPSGWVIRLKNDGYDNDAILDIINYFKNNPKLGKVDYAKQMDNRLNKAPGEGGGLSLGKTSNSGSGAGFNFKSGGGGGGLGGFRFGNKKGGKKTIKKIRRKSYKTKKNTKLKNTKKNKKKLLKEGVQLIG